MAKKKNIQLLKILPVILGVFLIFVVIISLISKQGPALITKPKADVGFEGNQKVSTTSPLYMSFPDKMDKSDTENNIEIPDNIEGEMSWDDNTLIFQPEQELKEGKTYTFLVNRDAKYKSGKPLNKDMEFRFTVGGPPEVTSNYPIADATEISTDSKIHIVFDRPIIPLSAVQGSGAIKYGDDWPITISPDAKGSWRWLGTSTAEFTPENELEPATTYSVNVPAGITTVIGDKTVEDFSWQFTTTLPKAISSDPYNNYKLAGPNTEITILFNQVIDLESALEHIRLYELKSEGENESLAFDITYGTDEIDDKKEVNKNKLLIAPSDSFQLKTDYQIIVSADIKGVRGELGSESDFTLNFTTVGDLKVEEAVLKNRNHIFINFSNPIDDETLEGNITISPEVKGWEDIEFTTNSWSDNREINIYPNLEPSTEYTVTLNEKIADRFGQTMKTAHSFTFTTPKLEPNLNISSNGEFGIFEDGKPPAFPLEMVNVSEVNIEFARIPFNEFLKIRQNKKENWRYNPDLSNYINYKKYKLSPKNELNKWETLYFEIEKELGQELAPGTYGISVQAPEFTSEYRGVTEPIILHNFFTLTNNALTLKYSGNKALIWVVDMQTGNPVEGANIKFYNLEGVEKLSGRTDSNGFFETGIDLKVFKTNSNTWNPEFWVTASESGDFTFISSQWSDGMEPWNFGLNSDFHDPDEAEYRLDSYIYTERQLYRPGDTVNFKGIVRLRDSNGISEIPTRQRALVRINDAEYNEIYNKTLTLNEFGSFSDEIPIDEGASLGRYGISLELIPDDDIYNNYGSHSFSVLAYRKPEYEVEVIPENENYFSGDDIKFAITGNYYFGAPMSEADVEWWASSADYWFNRYTDGWYSFALDEVWCWWYCEIKTEDVTEGKGKLDENGKMEIEFPYNLDDKNTSQIITVEADITDENNQVVSNRESVPVHKSGIYVGVKMQDYAVMPGEKASVNVITVDPDGKPVENKKVTVNLFSREWNTIKKKNVDGFYYYENEPKDTFIRKTSVTTDKDGKGTAEILVDEGGSYRVTAEIRDDEGRIAKSGTSLYAFSRTYINWPHSNNDRIDVVADKPEYAVGDTAKLLIKSPYQGEGVKALITVERENVISKKVIDVESNAQAIEIPITEDLIPNAFVSAVIIKPRDGDTFDENGKDTGMPAFKIGYVKLNVETERKRLNVVISTDKQKYGPGETVNVDIKTLNYNDKPVSAEVSLGVVDMSVQALLGFAMPDLIKRFYEERGLGVRTAEMLSYLIESFKPGSKGGGGGEPEEKVRKNFKDTAYWNPSIITDGNGEAKISFILPDNLTTWQLLAIAQTKNHLYGASVHEIIETKKVIIRPVRPRFAVVEDEIKIGAIVHNFTDEEKKFDVTLTGEGFSGTGGMEQSVKLKPDEHEKLIFPITINQTEKLTLHFKAASDDVMDEIEETIPVYIFGTPQSVATSGITEEEAMENVYIPSPDEAKHGKITTIISPTIASYLPKGLEYLVRFPYGCAEQTISSFLPNIAIAQLQNFDAFKIVSDEELEKIIIGGLERIYTFQRGDGGFGYWTESRESSPYLTTYIVYALEKTRKAGYGIDWDSLSRAQKYLESVLRNQDMENKMSLATRAYILYVLAESGRPDINLSNNLYEKRDKLPLFAKAYLAMSYKQSGDKAKKLMDEIINEIKIDSRGSHFEEENERYWCYSMNTNARTTAVVLQAMINIIPDNEQIPKIVRFLLAIREQGHWDTTQSTTASIFALVDYMKMTDELSGNYTAKIAIEGDEKLSEDFSAENILTKKELVTMFEDMKEEEMNSILISKEGEGRLYYDMTMDYFLTLDELPPIEQGIGIAKELTPLDEKDKSVKVNGTYKIKLTITVPEDRHFVAVSSPLPAGFEAIDFALKTSQQRLAEEINQDENNYWWNPLWYFNHIEFRDDSVFLFADYLPAGVYEYEYLARATTPGKFKYRPSRAWEMYFPETFGQTEGEWFEIESDS